MKLNKLALFSLILGFGFSVLACDSNDENDDKNNNKDQLEGAEQNQNPGNVQDGVSHQNLKCDENCPEEAQCIEGKCVLDMSRKCGATVCEDGYACINNKCILDNKAGNDEKCGDAVCKNGESCLDGTCVKTDDPQPGACETPCPEGYICDGGPQCVKVETPEPTGCETVCPQGYICNGTQCIIAADDVADCNVNPCDPTSVCVNSHYCLEVCANNAAKVISSIERLIDETAGSGDEQARAGFQVVKTQDELIALTTRLKESSYLNIPAYTPDFSKNWLLVVTSGEKSNTGYSMSLNSACVLGDKTTVTMDVDNCDTNAAGDALQWIWHIYEVPAQGEYEVEFREHHNVGCVNT